MGAFFFSFFSWCARSLFPGLEGKLLSDDLKPEVLAALKEAAKSRGNVSFVFSYSETNFSWFKQTSSKPKFKVMSLEVVFP